MKTKAFFTNKYYLALLVLVMLLLADVMLHKGMSRVILPESFTSLRKPQHPGYCLPNLINKNKQWQKAVNTGSQLQQLDHSLAGFEMDVYFDLKKNMFFVYHDSSNISQISLLQQLAIYRQRKLSASIWLDFKNLSDTNAVAALQKLQTLQKDFNLQQKLIVESPQIKNLSAFCKAGFFTSYYVPYFNPYLMQENELVAQIDLLAANLHKYKVSALSGYYFQIPMLKKFFPTANLLTWAEASPISVVGPIFNHQLLADNQIKVVLYN